MKYEAYDNPKEYTQYLIDWIRKYFAKNGGHTAKAIIGVSGGKDSTAAVALCVAALGADRVYGVLMPNGGSDTSYEAGVSVCEYYGINYSTVNICPMYEAYIHGAENIATPQVKINAQARIRMMILYSFAEYLHGRVVNTSNYSEKFVGYSTKYGDGAGDVSLLGNLTVTEVYLIMKELKVPQKFIDRPPMDGLSGKTDEENLGFTYAELDDYILNGTLPHNYGHYSNIMLRYEISKHKNCLAIPTAPRDFYKH